MTAGGTPVPMGMDQFQYIPFGDPLQVINPAGLDAGRRLRTIKDAEALRDATNLVLPTVKGLLSRLREMTLQEIWLVRELNKY